MKKKFDEPLSINQLNLDHKIRSNIFTWRGQFSPELIENLIEAYCPAHALILDPFCCSGTVLYEAGKYKLKAFGVEINPAAYILSKTYELLNLPRVKRDRLIHEFTDKFSATFPAPPIFQLNENKEASLSNFHNKITKLQYELDAKEKILLDSFVILMDVHNRAVTYENIYSSFYKLISSVKQFPYSTKPISVILGDARKLSLESNIIDFVITSPPLYQCI